MFLTLLDIVSDVVPVGGVSVMSHIVSIIREVLPVVSTVAVAWLGYNQYTKNKHTDHKIDKLREDDLLKRKALGADIARVYGELHKLLNGLGVDRAFVIQPHPLKRYDFLSVRFSVQRSGVSDIRDVIKDISISTVVNMTNAFAVEDWMFYNNVDDIVDKRAKALVRQGGAFCCAFCRLINEEGKWVGTLVVENTKNVCLHEGTCCSAMSKAAEMVQYTLPPVSYDE